MAPTSGMGSSRGWSGGWRSLSTAESREDRLYLLPFLNSRALKLLLLEELVRTAAVRGEGEEEEAEM